MRSPRFSVALVGASLLILALVGCTGAPVSPKPSQGEASASARPSSTPTPAPKYYPDGTAKGNKPVFDSVSRGVRAANPSAGGRDVIDALVAAGFDRANMQLTPDKTTINRAADSVLFSVRIGTDCLLGQFSGSEYTSSIQAALTSGACLVGQTRPIDW
ncbi:DUF6993 domain-containing protein [Parafrigoribacterium soli]|uniref:DUF6993 domain-containing protein n=1 Tax=Parafrigoribacterium soli TaxID=3144663 RepID=UPI0032F021DB